MGKVEKDHSWDHLVQCHCSSRVPSEHVYLGHCPDGCPYPVRETPAPLWATFLALSHHHSKVFPHRVQVGLPLFQFLLVASHPIAWHHQEEPGSILQILIYVDKTPSQTSSALKRPSSLSLPHNWGVPVSTTSPEPSCGFTPGLSCTEGPKSGHSTPWGLSRTEKGRITSLNFLLLTFQCTKTDFFFPSEEEWCLSKNCDNFATIEKKLCTCHGTGTFGMVGTKLKITQMCLPRSCPSTAWLPAIHLSCKITPTI